MRTVAFLQSLTEHLVYTSYTQWICIFAEKKCIYNILVGIFMYESTCIWNDVPNFKQSLLVSFSTWYSFIAFVLESFKLRLFFSASSTNRIYSVKFCRLEPRMLTLYFLSTFLHFGSGTWGKRQPTWEAFFIPHTDKSTNREREKGKKLQFFSSCFFPENVRFGNFGMEQLVWCIITAFFTHGNCLIKNLNPSCLSKIIPQFDLVIRQWSSSINLLNQNKFPDSFCCYLLLFPHHPCLCRHIHSDGELCACARTRYQSNRCARTLIMIKLEYTSTKQRQQIKRRNNDNFTSRFLSIHQFRAIDERVFQWIIARHDMKIPWPVSVCIICVYLALCVYNSSNQSVQIEFNSGNTDNNTNQDKKKKK